MKNPLTVSSLDWRFNAALCQQLDEIHRDEWRAEFQSVIEKFKVINLAAQKSLRSIRRSGLENDRAVQKHAIERSR